MSSTIVILQVSRRAEINLFCEKCKFKDCRQCMDTISVSLYTSLSGDSFPKILFTAYESVSRDLESCIFVLKKIIVGPQEGQYQQFLLQLSLTRAAQLAELWMTAEYP